MYFIKITKQAADTYLLKQCNELEADTISLHPIEDTVVPSADPHLVIQRLNEHPEPLQYYEMVNCIFDMPQDHRRDNLDTLTLKEMYDAYRCYCRAVSIKPVSNAIFSQTYQHINARYAGAKPERAGVDDDVCEFIDGNCEFVTEGKVHTDKLYNMFKKHYPKTKLNRNAFVADVRVLTKDRAKKGPVMIRGYQAQGFAGLRIKE